MTSTPKIVDSVNVLIMTDRVTIKYISKHLGISKLCLMILPFLRSDLDGCFYSMSTFLKLFYAKSGFLFLDFEYIFRLILYCIVLFLMHLQLLQHDYNWIIGLYWFLL